MTENNINDWQRSSFCGGGTCIEIKKHNDLIFIRNSVGTLLSFTLEEWDAFIKGVKDGEFDEGS